ncbi:hypothetical protein ACUY1T_16400 [Billgrantia sp. Q4P2]|uniref:hypothetical protein n=1 Tax=Billgrantia sp. Q4P2 TaxID=3463857 RepID=UPI004056E4AA
MVDVRFPILPKAYDLRPHLATGNRCLDTPFLTAVAAVELGEHGLAVGAQP